MWPWKRTLLSIGLATTLLVTGCSEKEQPEQEIFSTLEHVVELELDFEKQQVPLLELEQKEKELYDQIISLGMKEFEQIVGLAQEAITVVEQRQSHMEQEKTSIDDAKEHFQEVSSYMESLEESQLKEEAQQLYQLMEQRYEAYDELYNYYMEAISLDLQLYAMFQDENLTMEQLKSQIDSINEKYAEIKDANERFNNFTEKYNEMKFQFYKNAGLNVEYNK